MTLRESLDQAIPVRVAEGVSVRLAISRPNGSMLAVETLPDSVITFKWKRGVLAGEDYGWIEDVTPALDWEPF